jgi:hypothetical protein
MRGPLLGPQQAREAVSPAGPAAHIRSMTTLRQEAQDPATTPERLRELINLPGNRGDIDSDAGWCRELVAANPSAPLETTSGPIRSLIPTPRIHVLVWLVVG